jgi:hypothetical protein
VSWAGDKHARETDNAFKIAVGKTWREWTIWHRHEGYELDSSGSGYGPVAGTFWHGNKYSCFVEDGGISGAAERLLAS